uniref:Core-binding factor subunit beta n=2 Tax=Cyprinus carpio TaxID=7962 RepID=A0A8C2ALA9_CYPCA
MPRVVPDQRSKFENEEFFRKLSRECEIKYTGFRDRPHEERQARFQNACRDGRSEIAFVATGTNLSLQFFPANLHGDHVSLSQTRHIHGLDGQKPRFSIMIGFSLIHLKEK